MERKFEIVKRLEGIEFELPKRATANSAGYDFYNPEKVIIEAKETKLVKTGVKVKMNNDEYLELVNRSSNPIKKGLILINGVGIIDADYYNNESNEGEMAFALYNITDNPVVLEVGDKIGQAIFHKYYITEDDNAEGERTGGFGSTNK